MAVDVIARALAAKASQGGSGGSGNKVPIDITDAIGDGIDRLMDNHNSIVDIISLYIDNISADVYGHQIAVAGKDNVDLFFRVKGVGEIHQSFIFEARNLYWYCFLYYGP